MNNTTYYQKNGDVILNRAKDYYKTDLKKDEKSKQEINTDIYLKKIRIKRENMEETDTIICLKKRNKD